MSGRYQEPERPPGRPGAPMWRGGLRGIGAVTVGVAFVFAIVALIAVVVAVSY